MTTTIGTVRLNVADLELMLRFYENIIGLRVLDHAAASATLGVGETPLLELAHTPERKRYQGTTGLYHFAILVPTRRDLALSFRHLLQQQVRLQGASDHMVSEAVYLADPEGNGIEIYRDRPRADWYRNGQFQMSTLPMDAEGVLNELYRDPSPWQGLPAGTVMGHIHLHVADVREAATWYQERLGMEMMLDVGSAAFLSYDGYHHHIGINNWGVRSAAPDDALGLEDFDLHLAPERYASVTAGAAPGTGQQRLHDPSANEMRLVRLTR